MQHKYPSIKKLEVELKQLEEPITLPTRPCKLIIISSFLMCALWTSTYIVY